MLCSLHCNLYSFSGLDGTALEACAYGAEAKGYLTTSAAMASGRNANWSPTIFIEGELYCLWDSEPCQATDAEDFLVAICDAYTGVLPSGCP